MLGIDRQVLVMACQQQHIVTSNHAVHWLAVGSGMHERYASYIVAALGLSDGMDMLN